MSQPDFDRMPADDESPEALIPAARILHAMVDLNPDAIESPFLELDADLVAALRLVTVEGGSDLHVAGGSPPSLRVEGTLRPINGWPRWTPSKVAAALDSILSPEQRQEFARELELDFAYTIESARFRVNFYQLGQRGVSAHSK